jgi:hypothetical protein
MSSSSSPGIIQIENILFLQTSAIWWVFFVVSVWSLFPSSQVKILGSECRTSGIFAKRAKQATTKRQRRSFRVFYGLSSLPLAGSWSGCFHTSLGCEPRSLMRASLGWFDYSKKCEEGRSNSGLFASKRSETPHGACWSPLDAKSASTDAPNQRTQLTGEQHNRDM